MPSYQKVTLVGHLTRDVELRTTSGGTPVTDVSIAINERRKQGDEVREETTFVDITLWGRLAEIAADYLHKGDPILVEGKLRLETWESASGDKRSKLKVVAQQMLMLGARRTSSTNEDDAPPKDGKVPF
jgi:single-strand DNA-binding protein